MTRAYGENLNVFKCIVRVFNDRARKHNPSTDQSGSGSRLRSTYIGRYFRGAKSWLMP
jgi:hypothetical protein